MIRGRPSRSLAVSAALLASLVSLAACAIRGSAAAPALVRMPAARTAAKAVPTAPTAPAVSTAPAMPDTVVPAYWRTRAERTDYRQTPDYDETMRFCRQLEAGSRWIKVTSFGVSGQGRDLPLVIVSSDRAFTPEAARGTGKTIVLVQNGIHAGEIEGKDACLALMRDLAVLHKRTDLLDHAILLVIPILSVDAHERHGRYNRINQNGPEEMGWRFSPVGLNLNRDYIKVETPEMRALIGNVFTKWWPHLLVDDHTTDGSDWRYDITYGLNHGAGVPGPLDRWGREAFEGRVVPRLEALGHVVAPYLNFRTDNDPAGGFTYGNVPPRFSNGYTLLQNRPAVLVETHSLKPYGVRVRATYDLLIALLEEIEKRPRELPQAVADAEAEGVARARAADPAQRVVVLATDTTSTREPFDFKGWVTRWETSDITGGRVARYSTTPWDTVVSLQREMRAVITVTEPAGYLVPQEWRTCQDRLDVHAVRYRRFAQSWTDSAEFARVTDWSADRLFEGHYPTRVKSFSVERRLHTWRPGDLWVPCDQPAGRVAVELFEPQAPDGLTLWNAFDTVFERKEYAEDYVMEPIARRMLQNDVALLRDFQARLAADSSFARDPRARLDFLYRRSPWADPEQNLLPVARALHAPPERVLEPAAKP
jgi:hypothetical protein